MHDRAWWVPPPFTSSLSAICAAQRGNLSAVSNLAELSERHGRPWILVHLSLHFSERLSRPIADESAHDERRPQE
jgi:hypothetical protein